MVNEIKKCELYKKQNKNPLMHVIQYIYIAPKHKTNKECRPYVQYACRQMQMQLITERLVKTFQDIHGAITQQVNKIQNERQRQSTKIKDKQPSKDRQLTKQKQKISIIVQNIDPSDISQKSSDNNQPNVIGLHQNQFKSPSKYLSTQKHLQRDQYNQIHKQNNKYNAVQENISIEQHDKEKQNNKDKSASMLQIGTPQKKTYKKYRKRIIQRPKKPQNSFKLFMLQLKNNQLLNYGKDSISNRDSNNKEKDDSDPQNQLTKLANKRWQNMTSEQKKPYIELQKKQLDEYNRKLQQYYNENPDEKARDNQKKELKEERKKQKLIQKLQERNKQKGKSKQIGQKSKQKERQRQPRVSDYKQKERESNSKQQYKQKQKDKYLLKLQKARAKYERKNRRQANKQKNMSLSANEVVDENVDVDGQKDLSQIKRKQYRTQADKNEGIQRSGRKIANAQREKYMQKQMQKNINQQSIHRNPININLNENISSNINLNNMNMSQIQMQSQPEVDQPDNQDIEEQENQMLQNYNESINVDENMMINATLNMDANRNLANGRRINQSNNQLQEQQEDYQNDENDSFEKIIESGKLQIQKGLSQVKEQNRIHSHSNNMKAQQLLNMVISNGKEYNIQNIDSNIRYTHAGSNYTYPNISTCATANTAVHRPQFEDYLNLHGQHNNENSDSLGEDI